VAGGNKYDYEIWAKEVTLSSANHTPPANTLSQNGLGGFVASAAVDGQTDVKAWDTNNSSSGAFVRLNLGSLRRGYTAVQVFMSSNGSGSSYNVEHSDDGIAWTTLTQMNPTAAGWNTVEWPSAGSHQFWRLLLINTPGIGPHVTDMKWLEGPESVQHVTVYPLAQGEGTFDLVVLGTLELGVPSQDLLSKVYDHVNDKRPVGAGFSWGMRVLGPQVQMQNVHISGVGASWDKIATINSIRTYMWGLRVGQPLYKSQLAAIAHQHGAESVTVTTPSQDIIPQIAASQGIYQAIRPGEITVV